MLQLLQQQCLLPLTTNFDNQIYGRQQAGWLTGWLATTILQKAHPVLVENEEPNNLKLMTLTLAYVLDSGIFCGVIANNKVYPRSKIYTQHFTHDYYGLDTTTNVDIYQQSWLSSKHIQTISNILWFHEFYIHQQ